MDRFGAVAAQLWMSDEHGFHLFAAHGRSQDDIDRELALRAAIANRVCDDGRRIAQPLRVSGREGVLLLDVDTAALAAARPALQRAAELVAQRIPAALELHRLNSAVAQLAAAEKLQRALFAVAEVAASTRELAEVLQVIHGIVAGLMYAENFFVMLRDRTCSEVSFPYYRDVVDPNPPHPGDYQDTKAPRIKRQAGNLGR